MMQAQMMLVESKCLDEINAEHARERVHEAVDILRRKNRDRNKSLEMVEDLIYVLYGAMCRAEEERDFYRSLAESGKECSMCEGGQCNVCMANDHFSVPKLRDCGFIEMNEDSEEYKDETENVYWTDELRGTGTE